MAQHDYDLANQAGSLFRADLNNLCDAILTNNSGASAPSGSGLAAYMWWADTTTGWLKQRNAANTAWIEVMRLSNAAAIRRPISARSSNTIIAAADFGVLIRATSAFTQTLTAAATLGDGFHFSFRNDSASPCTIDPNSSEQIDGATTRTVAAGESVHVYCSGSAWFTIGAASEATGAIKIWGTTSAPAGYLLCDGSEVNRTTYAGLFAVIGTTFGAGNGSTTFNVPDLRSRLPIGYGAAGSSFSETVTFDDPVDQIVVASNVDKWVQCTTAVLSTTGTLPTGLSPGTPYFVWRLSDTRILLCSTAANAQAHANITFSGTGTGVHTLTGGFTSARATIGDKVGAESSGISIDQIPAHTHTIPWAATGLAAGSGANSVLPGTANTGSVGGSVFLNNTPPALVVGFIIKT
jgi:microcystin-dependent protein